MVIFIYINIYKDQKGITLVALIITIIVMLILVSVTLTIVLGENGIINKAKEAGKSTNTAVATETDVFVTNDNTAAQIDNYVHDTDNSFTLTTVPAAN